MIYYKICENLAEETGNKPEAQETDHFRADRPGHDFRCY